jgi:Family of unknown function (DUF5677)
MTRDFDAEFRDTGFLSAASRDSIPSLRAECKEWFELADDANRVMQQITIRGVEGKGSRGKTLDSPVLATFVQIRSASMIQAVILLTERGMTIEARTMVRSLLENALCMGALHDAPDEFVKMFKADYEASQKAQANIIKAQAASLSPQDAKKLDDLIGKIEKGVQTLSMKALADLSPLKRLYLLYRVLSNDAAHPSATSLHRYLNSAPDKKSWSGFIVGPGTTAEMVNCLTRLVEVVVALGVGYTVIIGDDAGNAEMRRLSNAYTALSKAKHRD